MLSDMGLIHITGVPGSGKTTVYRMLEQKGYEAYDTDEDDIAECIHDETGEPAPMPDNPEDLLSECPPEYSYKLNLKKVNDLLQRAKNKRIFLCGSGANQKEIWPRCEKVFILELSKNVMLQRIRTRTNNNYGKTPKQKAVILRWYEKTKEGYEFDVEKIDADQLLEDVVSDILEKLPEQD